ncbi:MAG: ABC transporter substrate-binding protein, partial [Planctomycetota bacterium]
TPVGDVVGDGVNEPVQVPFITWGGDVATFHANGGLETAAGSTYADLGLKLNLTPGDDFEQQVRDYLSGESPFLRGTFNMLALASGTIGQDPRTKPVVFLQLTWSAGDHLVTRGDINTIDDLKGKTIAVQDAGPHVGMLYDVLRTAQLGYDDVTIKFVPNLTGENSPAELFRNDPSIDAAAVISPDMFALTGGLDATGTGAEGTVEGAKVLVSTAQMSRSIADVYAVRKDFYDANKAMVEKFTAGYFKASAELVEGRRAYNQTGRSADYQAMMQLAQDIYGTDVLPTLEVDTHGLLMDAAFVGLPGNEVFFTDAASTTGFRAKEKAGIELATTLGYAQVAAGFFGPDFDYPELASAAGLEYTAPERAERFDAEAVELFPDEVLDENTLLAFTINFEPNQTDFPATVYGPEFARAIETAGRFGNAVVAVRGHADPTLTLRHLVQSGLDKGILKKRTSNGKTEYFFDGKPLDLESTDQIVALIEQGAFDGGQNNPRQTMQAALNLSRSRAQAVRDAIVAYAETQGVRIDPSQIQPVGVGVTEPLIAKPTSMEEATKNMRVEFRLLKVPAETLQESDFDF